MKLLLDECVDERLRLQFTGHDCQTARFAKLSGLKDQELPARAEAAGFEVLITTDQKIPYQQNLVGRAISIAILIAPTNRLQDSERVVERALAAIANAGKGQVLRVR